jgi:hypothetical protein
MNESLMELRLRPALPEKTARRYQQLQNLMAELQQQSLPPDLIAQINPELLRVEQEPDASPKLKSVIYSRQTQILRLVEKKLKIVPKNYYRTLWIVLGMFIFGLPFGVLYGLLIKNTAMLGIGLPIGMAIGVAVGAAMDKKAAKEGRQLDIEIKPNP